MSNYSIKNTPTKARLLEVLETLNFNDEDSSKMNECINDFLSSIPTEKEKRKTVLSIHRQAVNLARQLMERYAESVEEESHLLETEKQNYKLLLQQEAMAKSPKMVFTSADVLEITKKYGIRGKSTRNTIQSHIERGILKATKDANGFYQITRADLEVYLGFKDF